MSYDSDIENYYMVLFQSGRVIYVSQYTVQDVKEYCADEYEDEVIKEIYQEVYTNDGEEEQEFIMTFLVAKLNDKIVEIVKVAETVQFSNEKNWVLIGHEVNKRLSMKWLEVNKVKFDWIRRFTL